MSFYSRSGGSSGAPSGSSSPVAPENPSPGHVSPVPPTEVVASTSADAPAEEKPTDLLENQPTPVELHPRKRKIKPRDSQPTSESSDTPSSSAQVSVNPLDQPVTNCYQLFLNIRKQVESCMD